VEFLFLIHRGLAQALFLYLVALGIWGLVGWRRGGVSPNYVGSLLIAEGAAIFQTLTGVLVLLERPLPDTIHALYGVSIVLALPLAHLIARDRSSSQRALVYALASFFTAGLALRGIGTA
jgi:hypothetical protein